MSDAKRFDPSVRGDARSAVVGPGAPETTVVVLRVPDATCACENARKNANRTSLLGDAPKLPFRNCGWIDCRCYYERIADRRRGERRKSADRRDQIRFEIKEDRRKKSDRRKQNNPWNRDI